MKVLDQRIGKNYAIYHGDSCEVLKGIPTDSIHYSVTSIPFASLYTYSATDRDLGNSKDYSEFWTHYEFLIREWVRVMMPGRLISIHVMNLPTSKERDGYIGIRDFRGDVIRGDAGGGHDLSFRSLHLEEHCDGDAADKGTGATAQADQKGFVHVSAGHPGLSRYFSQARRQPGACDAHERIIPGQPLAACVRSCLYGWTLTRRTRFNARAPERSRTSATSARCSLK